MKFLNSLKSIFDFLKTNSPYSSMRTFSFIIIFSGAFYVMFSTFCHNPIDWAGVIGYVTVGLGGKAVQKHIEVKNGQTIEDNTDSDTSQKNNV